MLPNCDFNWKKEPEVLVWRTRTNDGETSVTQESYGCNECVSLFAEALKNNEVLFFYSYYMLVSCITYIASIWIWNHDIE